MLRNTLRTRILWLSDMHIWHAYKKMNGNVFHRELQRYFESFFQVIEKEETVDYVLLSGDIGFAGERRDYEYFESLFLGNFKKSKHKTAKLLVIPGNHDICWETSENLISTVKENGRKTYDNRTDSYLIESNESVYLKNFKHYSEFFNSPRLAPWVPKGCNDTYLKHKLFGYHVDAEKQLIFILLNSAWFSLGSNFSRLLGDRFVKGLKPKFNFLIKGPLDNKINSLLETKDNIAEYGNQVIGKRLLEDLDLISSVFQEYPEFTVVTAMHHPPNWLNWLERYNYNDDKQELQALHAILRYSNFLLTGHEHVPPLKSTEILDQATYHIKAGCFLDELKSNTEFVDLKHNRFSIIETNAGANNWLLENVFHYRPQPVNNKLMHEWKSEMKLPIFYDFKYAATETNIKDEKICVESYLRSKGLDHLITEKEDDVNYAIYEKNNKIFIVSKSSLAIKEIISIGFINSILSEKSLSSERVMIHFILKDTHCRPGLYMELNDEKDFSKIRQRRNQIFENFKTDFEMHFDAFRNQFFNSLESERITLKEIMNLNLISEVLPYWYFATLCNRETLIA